MTTKEAILSRRSVRAYEDRPIPLADLEEILELGTYAPSAVDLQPWYFMVIQSAEQMAKLREVMGRVSTLIEPVLQARFPQHPNVVVESTSFIRRLGGAPVCILAFQQKPEYEKTASTIIQSIAAATENILLAATDKGIGSCWLTAPLETGLGEELRETFAPGKGELVAMITLGYPAQEPKTPRRKDGRFAII